MNIALGSTWLEGSATNMRYAHICCNSGPCPMSYGLPFHKFHFLAAVELESIIQCFFFLTETFTFLSIKKKWLDLN